ncbi:hypothetical protein RN001_000299 [Aquatica leii]|uniref:SPIN-DOC-like zinc-finger domain-containing protein n=1 Tax=Aquatica leii TaxID=1421715 RepID=A0AAN7QLY9_9COLE|nr:hypothetical protein RN001_000299 [Aquatica leii]
MDLKKQKVDSKNKRLMAEWTEQYCFTLPDRPEAVPVCLICNKTVAIVKSGNLKRHYETSHQQFHKNFPLGSETRKEKLQAYLSYYNKSTKLLVRCMSEQEKFLKAALRVCWTLNKHQKRFSDSEILKACMLAVVTALFEERKDVAPIQSIPLSARSNTRRTEIVAADIKNTLLKLLQKTPCYVRTLDESCDIVDEKQMSIFVKFLDIECEIFRKELLAILSLKGNTQGEDLFKVIDEFITKSNISYDKVVSLSTEGAPAKIGKEKILVKLINFMRSHSVLQHRHFKEFLFECDSAYSDLLQHNNVRWLSKSQVIKPRKHFEFVTNKRNMLVVAFLKDILKYLNALNTELQRNKKLICDLIQSVSAFRQFIHFPTILEYKKETSEEKITVFVKFLTDLINKFATRFQDFVEMSKLSPFFKSLFEIDVAAEWADVAANLFNLLTDAHLEDTLRICCSSREPNYKKLAQDRRCSFSH